MTGNRGRALLRTVASVGAGVAVGLGLFTFDYGGGLSYFGTDPAICANCHIMQTQFDSWQKSGHHQAATCAGCHLPHDFPWKYVEKARNGWNHSVAFTTGNFPEPIRITPPNSKTLQENCVLCHAGLVHDIVATGELPCVSCHAGAGHGERAGLGGPEAKEPGPGRGSS